MTYVLVINLKLYQRSCEARNIRNETAMCTNVVGVEKALMDVIPILRDTLPNIRVKKKQNRNIPSYKPTTHTRGSITSEHNF